MVNSRHSELALVIVRLHVGSDLCHLLIRDEDWGDWSLVGGHVEPSEAGDWARAAARECDEELAPLRHSRDFLLLPLLDHPMRWGPIPSRSAGGELTTYTAQVFGMRFLTPPAVCLAPLPESKFRLVAESEIAGELAARVIRQMAAPLAWDTPLITSRLYGGKRG